MKSSTGGRLHLFRHRTSNQAAGVSNTKWNRTPSGLRMQWFSIASMCVGAGRLALGLWRGEGDHLVTNEHDWHLSVDLRAADSPENTLKRLYLI
jgi:hypothetical protein